MFQGILDFSLRFRGIIISLTILFLFFAIQRLGHVQYDIFPEFASPQVSIQTEAPGLSPEQVEMLVTTPIENVLNGTPHIELMRSDSLQGLSVINIAFEQKTDIYLARQLLAEKLGAIAATLPQGIEPPAMASLVSSTGDLLSIGLLSTTPKTSLMDIRTIADQLLIRKLQSIPGVAKASVFGGETRQIQIQVHPEKLTYYNLSLDEVFHASQMAAGIRGAGFIDTPGKRIILQTEDNNTKAADLAKTPLLQGNGSSLTLSITLGDVADVIEAAAPPISAASIGGKPGVIINIWGGYGANTVETTRAIETMIKQITPSLNDLGIAVYPNLFRAANFLEIALHNIRGSLLIGIGLVILIIILFLANLPTAAISCLAIPVSLLAAIMGLYLFGYSINTMTLAGLAIAIGEIVDDAVIDVENILRRLKENALATKQKPKLKVVYDASMEVRSSVIFATLAVVLVFVPILNLSGLAGRFFAPLGITYLLAVLASLIVALTLTPALCLAMLRPGDFMTGESRLASWLKPKYENLLISMTKNPKKVFITLGLMMLFGITSIPFFETSFLPDFKEGHFLAHVNAATGTSLEASLKLGEQISQKLLGIPEVRSVAQRVGRAESDDILGTHSSEFEIDLKPNSIDQSDEVAVRIHDVLKSIPDIDFSINTFLTERIEETLSGHIAPVVVNVVGDNLDILDQKGAEIADLIKTLEGAGEVSLASPPDTPQLKITLDKSALARFGLDSLTVLDAIHVAYEGEKVGQVYSNEFPVDVTVILSPGQRNKIEKIGEFKIRNPDGLYVPLKELATITESEGRYGISHESTHRVKTILCGDEDSNLSTLVANIKAAINEHIQLPPGTYIDIGGEAEAEAQSQKDLLVYSLLSLVGIFVVFSLADGIAGNLKLILVNLPFGLIGGLLAALISGGTLSLGSLVGFITLFGISLRNSIMMISHFHHLVHQEGKDWNTQTALQGASERLIPILMTSLITLFALLPLVLQSHKPGIEIEGPMAQIIMGGLITSTILNLLFLPLLAIKYGKFKKVALS